MICLLSEYNDIFGKAKKGVHSLRLFGTAVVDLILTVLLAVIIWKYMGIPFVPALVGLLVLGFVLHVLFGVETNAVRWLGLSCR